MSDESAVSSRAPSPVDAVSPEVPTARPYRFTWDPSRRGPASVSGTTEGGADYFATAPRFDGFNTSSLALALGALPSEWSSSKHGFHAISTVLNNPHKRQAPPKAHSALPAVLPADIPRVRRKDFDSYLRAISPEWDRFEKNGELAKEVFSQSDGPSTPRASLQSSITPRTLRQVQAKSMPPLNSVPSIFFEPVFNLGDPRTFNAVTETSDGDDDNSDPSSLSHSLPLLEKFSHYADTVEQHLVREISLRSTSFFAALTNLHELQSESEQCLDRISKLRRLLQDVDEKAAKRGLQMVRKESRMRNLDGLREGVKMVSGVLEITSVAKGLVAAGQWGEALGVIKEIEHLWSAEPVPASTPTPTTTQSFLSLPSRKSVRISPLPPTPETSILETKSTRPPPPVPLSSLHAFAFLPSSLRIMTMEIASALSLELLNVLRADLVDRMTGDSASPSSTQGVDADLALKDRIRPLLHGLSRTRGVRDATLAWREVVMTEVRVAIKRHLPSSEGDEDEDTWVSNGSNNEQTAGLVNHLRSLAHSDFLNLLRAIYKSLLNGIEGLQTQGGIIVDILEAVQTSNDSLDLPALQEGLSDILSSAAELSNTRAAKVVSIRSEQHATLDLANFLGFFDESWSFVLKCEVICRRMIVGLRGVVVSQAKVFLQNFHQTRISISAKLVEDEQWNPSEVSPHLQHVTNLLIDSAVRDSAELILNLEASSSSPPHPSASPTNDASPSTALSSQTTAPIARSNGSSTGSKHLRIEDRNYFAVSATAEVLMLLLDYLRVIVNLSTLTTDTMSRVIEYLKAFNSRTCQVVLGAGAMRSAGLKNITAKHLALASQSLSIMIALIPYVRETFRRHLNSKQAVMLVEFDKLKRDYQEHQNEIHAKLIAIMGDRLSAHIKTLQGINWETPKHAGVNDYMELLVKETVTLHKVLSRYLPIPIVEYVTTQVFAAINHRLSEEYGKIDLPHQEAKARLLTDAKYLHQKLSALKNVGTLSNMLETVITEKGVGPRQPPTAASTPTHPTANQRIKGIFAKSPTVDKATAQTSVSISTPTTNGIAKGETDANGRNNVPYVMSPPPSVPLPAYTPVQEALILTSEINQVDTSSPNLVSDQQAAAANAGLKQLGAENLVPPTRTRGNESAGIPSAGFDVLESPLPHLPPPPPPTPSTATRTGAELGYTDPFA